MNSQSHSTTTKTTTTTTTEPLITLHWALPQDIPQITHILHKNLLTFEFLEHFCPSRAQRPSAFHAFVLTRVRHFFAQPNCRFMVAVRRHTVSIDGSSTAEGEGRREIVGFATWEAHGRENALGKMWRAERGGVWAGLEGGLVGLQGWYERLVGGRSFFDYAGFERTWERLREVEGRVLGGKEGAVLHLQWLMVEPGWQRGKGVGRRLTQWGLDVADQMGMPVVLESSLVGRGFYERLGFEVLAMVRIDVVEEKAYDMPVLVKWPGGRKEEEEAGR